MKKNRALGGYKDQTRIERREGANLKVDHYLKDAVEMGLNNRHQRRAENRKSKDQNRG